MWKNRYVPLCALGFLATVLCFYPGFMSGDSIWQLMQAREGALNDWHPPVMGWVWSRLDRLVPGPFLMLVAQAAVVWTALALIAWQVFSGARRGAWVALAIGMSPPVFGLLGTIWKDVEMAAALLMAFALLLVSSRTKHGGRRRFARWGAWLALGYGIAVRHNAAAAALPLCLWAAWLNWGREAQVARRPRAGARGGARPSRAGWIARGLLVFCVLTVVANTVNGAISQGRKTYVYQILLAHDLAGISVATGENWLAEPYGISLDTVRKYYGPRLEFLYFWQKGPLPVLGDAGAVATLRARWWKAVSGHPLEYLEHRWRVFVASLCLTEEKSCYPYHVGVEANSLGVQWEPTAWGRAAQEYLALTREGPWFRAGWWLLAGLLLLTAGAARGRWRLLLWPRAWLRVPTAVLGASAVLYQLPYFLVSAGTDFRYAAWSAWACAIGMACLWAGRGLTDSRGL